MNLVKRKLVTIVTESALESTIIKDIKRLGAAGYTLTEAHGEGSHGTRIGDWDQNRSISIQIICKEEIAKNILEFVYDTYYEDYALVATLTDVEVSDQSKF